MGNSYFKFKQFTVFQDKCAMKVCTEACILGASVSLKSVTNILDIGTGTGLLSLMIAQRTEANTIGVEIDSNAYEQAKNNVEQTPWRKRIQIKNIDIQSFSANSTEKFDLIISNPPFFQNHLKSSIASKNIAKHTDSLSFEDLALSIQSLLTENGECYILLPEKEANIFEYTISKYNIYKASSLQIYQKKGDKIFRIINGFTRISKGIPETNNLFIYNEANDYSFEFKELLKEYYLNF